MNLCCFCASLLGCHPSRTFTERHTSKEATLTRHGEANRHPQRHRCERLGTSVFNEDNDEARKGIPINYDKTSINANNYKFISNIQTYSLPNSNLFFWRIWSSWSAFEKSLMCVCVWKRAKHRPNRLSHGRMREKINIAKNSALHVK